MMRHQMRLHGSRAYGMQQLLLYQGGLLPGIGPGDHNNLTIIPTPAPPPFPPPLLASLTNIILSAHAYDFTDDKGQVGHIR